MVLEYLTSQGFSPFTILCIIYTQNLFILLLVFYCLCRVFVTVLTELLAQMLLAVAAFSNMDKCHSIFPWKHTVFHYNFSIINGKSIQTRAMSWFLKSIKTVWDSFLTRLKRIILVSKHLLLASANFGSEIRNPHVTRAMWKQFERSKKSQQYYSVFLVAVGVVRRKQQEGDREKEEARKMLQSQQDEALNRGCQL